MLLSLFRNRIKKIVKHIKMITIPLNELRLITERRSIKN